MNSKPSVTAALEAYRRVRICEQALDAARTALGAVVDKLSDDETRQYLEAAAIVRQESSNASKKTRH